MTDMGDELIVTSEDVGEGIRVTVRYDELAEHANPRQWDNLGVMFCDYRGYDLGDEDAPDPREEPNIYEYLKREHGATVVLPLFLLDHSGLSMRAGEPFGSMESRGRFVGDDAGWDTSLVGVIFDTKESREECGTEPEHVEEALRQEVETYDAYLRGAVYYWTVEDEDGDVLESCGGYVGEDDYALSEAKSAAESIVAVRKRVARTNELALACWRT